MIINLIFKIYNWFCSLTASDWILLFTFFSIVWYTVETRVLRKWQKRTVQISILDLRQRILMHEDEMRNRGGSADRNLYNADIVNMMNDILEHGKFDFKRLFSPGIIPEKPKENFLKKWFKK